MQDASLKKSYKNDDIECLRCIAILFTLIQHVHLIYPWPIPGWALIGNHLGFWTGVDLFFVISGYVITCSLTGLYKSKHNQSNTLKAFWIKRIYRLIPSAWLWILIPFFWSIVILNSTDGPNTKTLINDAIAGMLNVANFHYAHCFNNRLLGEYCSTPLIIGHYWSLSVEEQFYIILPILLIFIPRRLIVPLLALGIVIQFNWNRPLFSYAWFFRTDGLMWGVLLALISQNTLYQAIGNVIKPHRKIVFVISLALISLLALIPAKIGGFGIYPVQKPLSFNMGLIALVSALLVMISSYNENFITPKSKLRPLLIAIGARSYSLYLIHVPVFIIAQIYLKNSIGTNNQSILMNLLLIICALAVSFGLTELNYRYVETPLRLKGRAIANKYSSKQAPSPQLDPAMN